MMSTTSNARWSDDSTRVTHVLILSVSGFMALFAVLLRLCARNMKRLTLAVDDYLCLAGLAVALALTTFDVYSIVYWDLGGEPTQQGQPAAVFSLIILQVKAMLVGQILWVTAVSLIRASVLCLYIHIFRTNSFCLACYTVHVFNFLYFGSTIMAACLICRPLAANWDAGIGHCGNQKSLDLYIGVFNLLMDICVVILPMPVLWHLQMSQSKKVVLSGMFGMGIVICAVTLARIRVTSLIHDGNEQKIYALITLFACLEAQLSVINTCLPVMRPVFTKLNSKIWFWTSGLSKINLHRLNTISGRGQYSQRSSRKGDSHNQRLHSRPSTASCSITSRRGDDRAVIMMDSNDASHISTNLVSSRPQLPPESKDCSSETRSEVLKTAQVIVNPDWDIEKVRGGE